MILLPPDTLKDRINPYYQEFRRSESTLLGYWPCQNSEDIWCKYYTCETADKKQRVVPVFFVPDMEFDSGGRAPALFFLGCDDGHLGIYVDSLQAGLQWIEDSPYVDFNQMFKDHAEGKTNFKFEWHN